MRRRKKGKKVKKKRIKLNENERLDHEMVEH
jgi:hypothetical protein